MRNEYPNVSYWFKSELGVAPAAVAEAERIRREEQWRRECEETRQAPPPPYRFWTVSQTVHAISRLLFTQELRLERWNASPTKFVRSFFGTGQFAPPDEFVAEVVRRVEKWLTAHPAFRRDSTGKWEWGVW